MAPFIALGVIVLSASPVLAQADADTKERLEA